MISVVPDVVIDEKNNSFNQYDYDSGSDSRPNDFILTQGDPTQLYVEREAPNIANLVTHPLFGATLDVAGAYTCVAIGKYVNTTKELILEVSGLFKRNVIYIIAKFTKGAKNSI